MNIYEKLTNIQNDLLEVPIGKSGKNPFGGFNYYELDDILPPILKLCKEYGCTLFFNFPTDMNGNSTGGVLNLVNWEDKEDKICVEVPFATLEKLPKMNYAQSSGTYQTYMKRYLLLHTFGIVETEIIDSLEEKPKKSTAKKGKKKSTPKKLEKPVALDKVIEKCHEEYGAEECNKKMLNKVSMDMARDKEISSTERKEIMAYLKTMKE